MKKVETKLKGPFVLAILDGWGIAPAWGGNAISAAKTVNFDGLWKKYPRTTLNASGGYVGLPENEPGNSEAGHLNIGAGRVVFQDQSGITDEIDKDSFLDNKVLLDALDQAVRKKSRIHIMGLISSSSNHSKIEHLFALLKFFASKKFERVDIHLFSDGRDSDPMSGIVLVDKAEKEIKKIGVGKIVSITGRYWAMDRDNHWERTAVAYRALTEGVADKVANSREAFSTSYSNGVNDEFLKPKIISNKSVHFNTIKDNDVIILFNFRFDRARQLIDIFLDGPIKEMPKRLKLRGIYFCTFATDPENQNNIRSIIPLKTITGTLAEKISEVKLKQFHIAETEKYAHVTYFFNGGRSDLFPGEMRLMIPSPRVSTYDKTPSMSAGKVTKALLGRISIKVANFYVVNFANADMVGHTGDLGATILAVKYVDDCLGKLIKSVLKRKGTMIVCSDHGNAEQMVNPRSGEPDPEHSTNPVPFIVVNEDLKDKIALLNNGSLCNIAPTILDLCGMEKTKEMSKTESLIKKKIDE